MRIFDSEAQAAAGGELAARVAGFDPGAVIFVRDGGTALGLAIAGALSLPAFGIDAHYPLRRALDRLPAPLRTALWPIKELLYRALGPRLDGSGLDRLPPFDRAVLVDDTASSGRTLRLARAALESRGVRRESLRVAVIRCGARARGQVDVFLTEDRVRVLR